SRDANPFDLVASVFTLDDARAAVAAGATTIVLDVFLRHPTPPVTRVRALADELSAQGVAFRLRTPTIVRPEERRVVQKWLDRVPTTCRDLCVQKHTNVELTDPTGYAFPVATDSACRNRLLHSRPIEGGEFLPRLWRGGLRNYHLVFNVPGEPIAQVVSGYR